MSLSKIIKKLLLQISSIICYNNDSKILFYHDVYDAQWYKALDCDENMGTHINVFKKHINIIKKEGYNIVPRITNKKKEVCIMFDDGFRGIWDCKEYFFENNIYPTVFIAIDLIGKPGYLTEEEIKFLQERGFIFECHSWTHTNLARKNDIELKLELSSSKETLSKILNKEITEICLPIGFYTEHLVDKAKEYNYKKIYSSIPGNYYDTLPNGLIRRNLCQHSSANDVKYILRGGFELTKKRYEKMHNLTQR